MRKDFSYTTTQTNTVIWTPASDKRIVITDFFINIRNSTLGSLTVSIFDDSDVQGNRFYRATIEADGQINFAGTLTNPFESSNINQILKLTTSGNLIINCTLFGNEIG